jgi:glycosyltransferase involved in cell wall biosynthesis
LREIWPRVRREVPDARLLIVGGEADVRMKEFEGKNNVILTGWVQDVRPYLNEASVVVAPVFEGAGMRTKVLEAWAMQKPVVGTNLSFEGLTGESGELGYIVDQTDQFAHDIELLLSDPELARGMGQRARRFVEEGFSWEAFADIYDRIYSELLGKHKAQKQVIEGNAATEALVRTEELQGER